jgi:hypothetical protein
MKDNVYTMKTKGKKMAIIHGDTSQSSHRFSNVNHEKKNTGEPWRINFQKENQE